LPFATHRQRLHAGLQREESPMADDIFDSAAERIEFGQMADCIERGQREMVPARLIERYVELGLMSRDGGQVRLTERGREQHRIATSERTSDG
jgi:hypothetical protein